MDKLLERFLNILILIHNQNHLQKCHQAVMDN